MSNVIYSNQKCVACNISFLKKSMIEKKENTPICFKCYRKDKIMVTARESRVANSVGQKIGRKKGIYRKDI